MNAITSRTEPDMADPFSLHSYKTIMPLRKFELFSEFLPIGYKATTLSCVSSDFLPDSLLAKCLLGTLITLIDDLADEPGRFDLILLKRIWSYLNGIDYPYSDFTHHQKSTYFLAQNIINRLQKTLKKLPSHSRYQEIFDFDLNQIFLANQYSYCINKSNDSINNKEISLNGPYNMGMVAAHMIDLMATKDTNVEFSGNERSVFLLGQRYGRICNMMTTYKREANNGDVTNEMLFHLSQQDLNIREFAWCQIKRTFENEQEEIISKILSNKKIPHNFSLECYIASLKDLKKIHFDFRNII